MDHLPLPQNATLVDTISVPLLLTDWTADDCRDFKNYPSRKGWDVDLSGFKIQYRRGGSKADARDITALLQAWLYFEMLSIVTEQPFDLQDFTRINAQGETLLTSACLESFMIRWTESVMSQSWSKDELEFRSWHAKVDKYLLFARDILLRTKSYGDSLDKDFRLVFMSIFALGEYFSSALYDMFRARHWTTPVDITWRISGEYDCGELLIEYMLDKGWCPFKVAGLDRPLMKLSSLWFFAHIKPPKASEHIRIKSKDPCTSSHCQIIDVVKAEYIIAHQVPHCSCDMVGPEQTELATALYGGTIPIIRLQKVAKSGERSIISCEAQPYRQEVPYVAISHIWADGHGNPHDNALPTCFLSTLMDLLRALPGTESTTGIKIWLDTLCVPRGGLKELALTRLREPYQWATKVLVLDSYLRALTSDDMSVPEIVAHIRTSAWAQRLWTFKEGRLAEERLWFQFKDRAVNVFDLVQNRWRMEWTYIPTIAWHVLDISILVSYTCSKAWSIEPLVEGLRNVHALRQDLVARTSSHMEDEGICLTNIMALDIGPILSAPIDDRMKVFWSLLPAVAEGMVLSSASRKLTHPGYRWAPASFMGDSESPRWSGPDYAQDATAIPTAAGLLVNVFAYLTYPVQQQQETLLSPAESKAEIINMINEKTPYQRSWLLRDELGNWYSCGLEEPWHQDAALTSVNDDLAILMVHKIRPNRFRAEEQFGHLSYTRGIIVSYMKSAEQCQPIMAKANLHVDVKQLAPGDCKFYERLRTINIQITTAALEAGGVSAPNLKDVVKAARKHALEQMLADEESLQLLMKVKAFYGVKYDREEAIVDLEQLVFRLMADRPWYEIRMAAEKSSWIVD